MPLDGDDLVFPDNTTAFNSTNDLSPLLKIHSITITGYIYRIGGHSIVLGSGGITSTRLAPSNDIYATLDLPIILDAAQTWSLTPGSQDLHVGDVNLNGNALTLDVNSAYLGVKFASISGHGGITKTGSASAWIGGPSEIGGPVAVSSGTIALFSTTTADLTVTFDATVRTFTPSHANNLILGPYAHLMSEYQSTLHVTRAVVLNNSTLDPTSAGMHPASMTIISNDGTAPVTGTFLGLPEGAIINDLWDSFRISYVGGDGNDVTLTRLDVPAVTTATSFPGFYPTLNLVKSVIARQQVILTVNVAAMTGLPTGTVDFYDDGVFIGSAPLKVSNGISQATLAMTATGGGLHSITAAYLGTAGFATSRGVMQLSVLRNRVLR